MSLKVKAVLIGVALVALLAVYFSYKKVIASFVMTAGFGALLLLVVYLMFKFWLWKRKRRRRGRRR